VCERENAFASVCAIARSYPMYSMKTNFTKSKTKYEFNIEFILVGEDKTPFSRQDTDAMDSAIEAIRIATLIVDSPCNYMNTELFLRVISYTK